jgi:hypothetical protein
MVGQDKSAGRQCYSQLSGLPEDSTAQLKNDVEKKVNRKPKEKSSAEEKSLPPPLSRKVRRGTSGKLYQEV